MEAEIIRADSGSEAAVVNVPGPDIDEAQVPTLLDAHEPASAAEPSADVVTDVEPRMVEVDTPEGSSADTPEDAQALEASGEEAEDGAAQEPAAQADTWVEQVQIRIGRLAGDIQALHRRLDLMVGKTKE